MIEIPEKDTIMLKNFQSLMETFHEDLHGLELNISDLYHFTPDHVFLFLN